MSEVLERARVAVSRGDTYCSPRCGFGCKREAYDQAVREGDDLARRMGPGWQPEVWENAGWHYQVRKGVSSIHVTLKGSTLRGGWSVVGYSAWIEPEGKQFIERANNPEDALGFATQSARTHIARVEQALADQE